MDQKGQGGQEGKMRSLRWGTTYVNRNCFQSVGGWLDTTLLSNDSRQHAIMRKETLREQALKMN